MRKILHLRLYLLLPLVHLLALAPALPERPAASNASPVPLPPPLIAAMGPLEAGPNGALAPDQTPTYADRVAELDNEERREHGGLPLLKRFDSLDAPALLHSTYMAVRHFFAHCVPDTLTWPGDRMAAAGYSWHAAAENIAAGYSSPEAVMAGWMGSNSPRTTSSASPSSSVQRVPVPQCAMP